LERAEIKIAVGGVDVGGLIPWLQRLLVNRRTLEFTFYERDKDAIVSGSLEALGLPGEALRLTVEKTGGTFLDLDQITTRVAAELIRRRLAGDPSNRVDRLTPGQFADLLDILNVAALLKQQSNPSRSDYEALFARVEPIANAASDWYPLRVLATNIAYSAGTPDRVGPLLQNAKNALQASLATADRKSRADIESQIKELTNLIDAGPVAAGARSVSNPLQQIQDDARQATEAYNKLFHHELPAVPVELLPPHEANAYFDGKKFFAPPAVAYLPEITWHDMTWQHLNVYIPVFSADDSETLAVIYSYSDVLPMLIRQLRLVEGPDPRSWDLYRGAVGWLEAAVQKQDFKPGSDQRPLRSFASPGQAYTSAAIGKDPQVASYREYKRGMEQHAASGIGNKAFYETATRVGVERAGQIWIAALSLLKDQKRFSYPTWADKLTQAAGADAPKIIEALRVLNLDVQRSSEVAPALPAAPRKRARASTPANN
jgi:hypothetical protein